MPPRSEERTLLDAPMARKQKSVKKKAEPKVASKTAPPGNNFASFQGKSAGCVHCGTCSKNRLSLQSEAEFAGNGNGCAVVRAPGPSDLRGGAT